MEGNSIIPTSLVMTEELGRYFIYKSIVLLLANAGFKGKRKKRKKT